jgi:hypothetical protein
MKITTVSLSRTIPTGAFMNDKVTLEASLHPGESHETVLDNLSHLINDWHRKANPHLYQESKPQVGGVMFFDNDGNKTGVVMPGQSPTIDYKKWDQFEIAIENAQTLEELETIVRSTDTFPGKLLSIINAKRQSFKP